MAFLENFEILSSISELRLCIFPAGDSRDRLLVQVSRIALSLRLSVEGYPTYLLYRP